MVSLVLLGCVCIDCVSRLDRDHIHLGWKTHAFTQLYVDLVFPSCPSYPHFNCMDCSRVCQYGSSYGWRYVLLDRCICLYIMFSIIYMIVLFTCWMLIYIYIYIYIYIMIDYCQGDDQNSGPDATSMRIIQLLGNKEKNPIIYYVDNYIFSVSQSSLYLIH
jgi:hypothetical protein